MRRVPGWRVSQAPASQGCAEAPRKNDTDVRAPAPGRGAPRHDEGPIVCHVADCPSTEPGFLHSCLPGLPAPPQGRVTWGPR